MRQKTVMIYGPTLKLADGGRGEARLLSLGKKRKHE